MPDVKCMYVMNLKRVKGFLVNSFFFTYLWF